MLTRLRLRLRLRLRKPSDAEKDATRQRNETAPSGIK